MQQSNKGVNLRISLSKSSEITFWLKWQRIATVTRMIVFFYQLDAQILYFNKFIMLIYMFRALLCSSSGGQILLVQHLVSSLSLGDCTVHSLRESSRNLCTEQSPKERDDTRCCTNTICPPEDDHNSARNM